MAKCKVMATGGYQCFDVAPEGRCLHGECEHQITTREYLELGRAKLNGIPDCGGWRESQKVEKLRYDLLPPLAMEELVKVFTVGARKYEDRNWEKGFPWMSVVACLLRHVFAWMKGEDLDKESGLNHMAHTAWNALALVEFAIRKTGRDDRPYREEVAEAIGAAGGPV